MSRAWALVASLALLGPLVSAVSTYVEVPQETTVNGTEYSISELTSKLFVRTDEFELNATSCLQYSFHFKERRVRLRAYTCLMSEGGFCTMDKFRYPDDIEGCTYLRPWLHKVDRFSFYFVLEKRPRKYGPAYKERQKRLRKRQTKKIGKISADPIGSVRLEGVMPCRQVCGAPTDKRLGSQSDGTFHRKDQGRPN